MSLKLSLRLASIMIIHRQKAHIRMTLLWFILQVKQRI